MSFGQQPTYPYKLNRAAQIVSVEKQGTVRLILEDGKSDEENQNGIFHAFRFFLLFGPLKSHVLTIMTIFWHFLTFYNSYSKLEKKLL